MPLQQPSFLDILLQLLPYIFGTGGFIAFYIAWKTRNSQIKQTEASALESIDNIYDKMSLRMEKELTKYQCTIDKQNEKIETLTSDIDKFLGEIKKTKNMLDRYIDQCTACPTNKIK